MRPRAGTRPVTLEPSMVVEVLSLARRHDEILKEMRQDLLRAETQLQAERRWKWPIRIGCLALGAASVIAIQDDAIRASVADFARTAVDGIASAGNAALIGLVLTGVALYGAVWLLRRILRGPSPEQTARKLMQQFAQRDGVASYVFAGEESADDQASSIDALTSQKNKRFRQRRLTASNRTLSSSLQSLLNSSDDNPPMLH
ncbi:MAG: hypothetical protein QM773_05460 [Hyphomonadaceae bacterium]